MKEGKMDIHTHATICYYMPVWGTTLHNYADAGVYRRKHVENGFTTNYGFVQIYSAPREL